MSQTFDLRRIRLVDSDDHSLILREGALDQSCDLVCSGSTGADIPLLGELEEFFVGQVGVAIHALLNDSTSGTQHRYVFDESVELVLQGDGSVEVLTPISDGVAMVQGTIQAPWAVDASGSPVDTTYAVEDNVLIQEVHLDGAERFPVVADPKIVWTWKGPAIALNKSETRQARDLTYAAALCSMAGIYAPLCALNVAGVALWSRRAHAVGKCSRFVIYPAGLYGEIYSGGYCT